MRLKGEENRSTIGAAYNLASALNDLQQPEEAKKVLRKMLPVAPRVLGESNELTLMMRKVYARTLYENPAATLDDLSEAATTLEDTARTAQRVLGGAYPMVAEIEQALQASRAALSAREGQRA